MRRFLFPIIFVPFTFLLSGCFASKTGIEKEGELHRGPLLKKSRKVSTDAKVKPIAAELPKIKLRDSAEMRRFLSLYTKSQRSFITEAMPRRMQYAPMIERNLLKHGLPVGLINLAHIESRFHPRARSPQGATGMWQFMKGTAKLYGLRVDVFTDERKSPEKSTQAAARYLSRLYEIFGDWYLALAAYNAGPKRVKQAIAKCGTEDFFEMSDCGGFRQETKDLVAKFIALTLIFRNLDLYGFSNDPFLAQ